MKDKKTRKFLKAAKKLIKRIRKHGKDGEVLLMEIKKLMDPVKLGSSGKKTAKKAASKNRAKKSGERALKLERPASVNPPEEGKAPKA